VYYRSMDTTKNLKTSNTLTLGKIVQEDGFTMQDAGSIMLGSKSFDVRIQVMAPKGDYPGEVVTWLKGARGADYILEPTKHIDPDGTYRLLSFNGGSFLKLKSGKDLRVTMLGTVIEVA
jgi:hypothetical protein